MPYGYFLYEDDTYTDFMDWAVIPGVAPEGAIWTEGRPNGKAEHAPVTLEMILSKEFDKLPAELQIAFAMHETAIKLAIEQGKAWKVIGIIETAAVPEALKPYENLLNEFRNNLLKLVK